MSDDKKPKKDLRARLGRTISPNQQGGTAPIAPPSAVPSAGAPAPRASVPPPAIGAPSPMSVPAPPGGLVPPPVVPTGGNPFGPPGIVPPFGRPQSIAPKPAVADPFAAGPSAAGPKEVRLVIDDKAVDDAEVGRKTSGRAFAILGVGLLVGAAVGWGFSSTNGRNVIYNTTVEDGHAIYQVVETSSRVVSDAQAKIDRLAEAASGANGQPLRVDYETVQQLRALENPLPASAFHRRNYMLFAAESVDGLFQYYDRVQRLWAGFTRLANTTLSEARRAELDRTAGVTGERATAAYGVIPTNTEEGVRGALVFVDVPSDPRATKVMARPARGAAGRELELFTPQTEVGNAAASIILLNNRESRGVLSEQMGAFGIYVQDVLALKQLMAETIEIQGRLTTSLSQIAALQPTFAF